MPSGREGGWCPGKYTLPRGIWKDMQFCTWFRSCWFTHYNEQAFTVHELEYLLSQAYFCETVLQSCMHVESCGNFICLYVSCHVTDISACQISLACDGYGKILVTDCYNLMEKRVKLQRRGVSVTSSQRCQSCQQPLISRGRYPPHNTIEITAFSPVVYFKLMLYDIDPGIISSGLF